MFSLNIPYTLGLTATPSRKDGLERLIHHFLGPSAYEKALHVERDVFVHIIKYTCDAYASAQPLNVRGDIDYTKILTMIANDSARTQYIADIIDRDLRGKDVLVLSHRRAHCSALVDALRERDLDAQLYIGGVKEIPSSKIIVSSYAYVSEGFDEPRLEALVLATPASDVAQTMGRILRGNDGTKTPRIIDVVDTWGVCFAQAAKRRRQYASAGFILK
jgi:superfamily II DNA or RNA helicase